MTHRATRSRLLSSTLLCGTLITAQAVMPLPAFAEGGGGGGVYTYQNDAQGGADSATGAGGPGGSALGLGNFGGPGGGAGVTGGAGRSGFGTPGAGGAGATAAGGAGSDGGQGGSGNGGGGGGGGGAHGQMLTTTTTDAGAIGGDGGRGGNGAPSGGGGGVGGGGGGGGAAGWGVVVDGSGLTYALTGTAAGGTGGAGGNGSGTSGHGGDGGTGGTGVNFTGSGTLANSGSISGGTGGVGGTSAYSAGAAGAGGTGVVGADLTIINAGAIAGGLSGDGVMRANAISFAGGTNSLTLRAGGITGTILGNIAVAGSLAIDPGTLAGDSVTLANIITDNGTAGSVTKIGAGTLVLSATNTYSGGTQISGGTLRIASDDNLGNASGGLTFASGTLATTASFDTARAVTLAGDGALDVATGTMLGLTGTVTGAGGLTKDGFGTLVLSGANNYQGGTVLEDGILQVAANANLGAASGGLAFSGGMLATSASFASARDVAVATVGGFDVAGDTQLDLSGTVTGAGTLAKLGAGALVLSGTSEVDWNVQAGDLTANAADFSGDVAIGSGAGFTFDQSADAAYAGRLSGSGGFTKTGAALLNLTGDSSSFTGTTTVAAGLMSVNGSLGGTLDVRAGGTLGGNGTVGTTTISGTVAPGNSVGTLNVAGDVTFNPGSTYEVEILGNGTSDLIAATGQAFINGGTVEVIALDPETSYQNGQSYTILTAAGGVSGAFDAAVSESIFLNVSAEDLLNGVNLTIAIKGDGPEPTPPVFTSAAITLNQFATASALDTLPQAGAELALYNALLFLPSAAEAQYAFDQLSGEANASAKGMFIEQSGLLRTAMIDRLRASFGAVGSSSAPVLSYAAPSGPGATEAGMALKAAAAAPATTETFAMWTSGFGSWGEMDGTVNAASLSSSTGGFLIGADATLGAGWRLGVTGGYSYTDFDVDALNSSGNSENWHIGLYGGNQWGRLGLRTGLAYTWHDVDTTRAVGFTGFGDYLTGSYDAGTFQAFGELGYRIDTAFAVAFEPFANLAYVSLHTDGFGESGGAAALTGNSSDTDTSFTTLGVRASTQLMLGNAATTLRGALGWRHAFGDVVPVATQSFLGSEAFTVSGAPIAEDAALVEAGLDVLIGASTTLGVAYTGQFGDGVTQNGFNATLKVSF